MLRIATSLALALASLTALAQPAAPAIEDELVLITPVAKTLTDPASLTVLPADVRSIVARSNASAVVVALNDGTSFYVGLDKIDTAGTGGATTPTSLFTIGDANTQTLLKAYFNLLFVNNDGAKGTHNPAFAAAALDNATAALSTVTLP